MPTQETKSIDDIITSRRALLVAGGAALAALAMPKAAKAASTVTAYTDNDILNFALNLEYLEANYYYLAAFGTTIDVANAASTAAGALTLGINGVGGAGVQASYTGTAASNKVPFTTARVAGYAVETAVEEGKHVGFLRGALGGLAVAQPQLNLTIPVFTQLATAAGASSAFLPFNPYASDATFLVGAYIFEDVGVSAYHGAAPLITNKTGILPAAVGIHAVEAYHAGLVRTSIYLLDPNNTSGFITLTQQISGLRTKLAQQLPQTPTNPEDPTPDDYGLSVGTSALLTSTMSAATATAPASPGSTVQRTQLVDADPVMVTGFARSTAQVLNIVTGGGATTVGQKATGIFYPAGMNGLFS